MRVVISGSTGFIGRALVGELVRRGDEVLALSRRPALAHKYFGEAVKVARWTPEYAPEWGELIEGYDGVVNLAGEPIIGRRWSESQKERILKSRVESTAGIIKAIRRADHRPDVFVNASAIGYYGSHGDEPLAENAPPGEGFLADVCLAVEEETEDDDTENVRTVRIRSGVVLGTDGGALAKMAAPFKLFLGGPLGSGRQWVSWIHLADLIGIILLALENPQAEGPLNGTAPNPVTNREFARTMGRVLGRPSFFPTPAVLLRLVLGDLADLLLQGQRVIPTRVGELGYTFKHPDLDGALRDLLR